MNKKNKAKTILLVGNPTSHSGKSKKRIQLALDLMKQKNIQVDFCETLPEKKTIEVVTKAIDKQGYRTIVYMGGDGTFLEVATGICKSKHTDEVLMGLLPSGTANDQGQSFGISSAPSDLSKNIDIILAGCTTTLDVGEITAFDYAKNPSNKGLFFDSLGWGLSAAILAFRNKELKQVQKMPLWRDMYKDQALYVRAAFHQFGISWLTGDRFSAEIVVDGKVYTFDSLSDLMINNTLIYAGEWMVDPKSSHNDGKVEIVPFKGLTEWTTKLITLHKNVPFDVQLLNKIGIPQTVPLKGSNIKIHILRPSVDKRLPAQRDGEEFFPADDYEIKIHPRLLNIIVPKSFLENK